MLALLAFDILPQGGGTPEQPNGEPVSFELAREFARLDDTTSDTLLMVWIKAARLAVEKRTGLALVRRQFVEEHKPCAWGYLELYRGPVISLGDITYYDKANEEQAYVGAVLRANQRRVYPALDAPWPARADGGGLIVTYTAGFAHGTVDENLLHAMLLLISASDKEREGNEKEKLIRENAAWAFCDMDRTISV